MDGNTIPWSEIESLCVEKNPATKGFKFIRTAYKVKDPRISIKFYNGILGMTVLNTLDLPSIKSTFYSLGYVASSEAVPEWSDTRSRNYWAMTRTSILELMHVWGTELKPDFQYNLGNGYANISLMVPNVHDACKRLESLGVEFIKKPNDGDDLKGLAFFKDPEGYTIEMYDSKTVYDNI